VEPTSTARILKTALELFSSKGYDATSVRELCEGAGITKPTLYHFYESKEGVYRALVDGALDDFRRRLMNALEAPGSVSEKLKRVAREHFDYGHRNRELTRFIMGLVYNPSRSAAPATDFGRFHEEVGGLIADAIERGVEAGELAPGPLEARMLVFLGAVGEALCGNVMTGRPALTGELADSLVETILQGWRPSPTSYQS
jgi:AcrR family transcriptional regulator